jgi:clorobiocin biosynthesis protein CloN6
MSGEVTGRAAGQGAGVGQPAPGAGRASVADGGGIAADLILLHAPSVFDFRERDDLLFAYLSDSDSVNVTAIYEQYPLGFLALRQHLRSRGLGVEIVNVAALMLQHPALDVDRLLGLLAAPVYGIDLHWLCHCQGALALAARVRHAHPEALIIFGGISSTYFAEELIRHPQVDVVVQGYDTLEPVALLVAAAAGGGRELGAVPNLLWKDRRGEVVRTGFSHKPARVYNDAAADWSFYERAAPSPTGSRSIMTLPNTGCGHDCPWCGGSRYAYRRIMGVERTLIPRPHERLEEELRSLGEAARTTSIYALQCYSEGPARLTRYLDVVRELGVRSVFFEQFHLTSAEMLRRMARSTAAYIMLSPESHDPEISRLAGRGTYSMARMEEWIGEALAAGIQGVMVWFFIGMPRQTPESVRATVDYCTALLRKFAGRPVLPLVCPMVPFLDPGSRFFEEPEQHGYRIFHRTLAEHCRAMVEPLWHTRLNYETRWLSRREIQEATYEAIARLVACKGELGLLPRSTTGAILATIDETRALLGEMERALAVERALPAGLRAEIRRYNRRILSYSSDQIVPLERPFGGRWFDDFTVSPALIARASAGAGGVLPGGAA